MTDPETPSETATSEYSMWRFRNFVCESDLAEMNRSGLRESGQKMQAADETAKWIMRRLGEFASRQPRDGQFRDLAIRDAIDHLKRLGVPHD